MDTLITTATARQEQDRGAQVAVLPVGSFEQHGSFLLLITDTIVACLIAQRLSADDELLLLPPVTLSCSHGHRGFAGTVSISADTLIAVVTDVAQSLRRSGIRRLAIGNGHGGNSVLATGMRGYTESGVIGRPSLASAEKGHAILDSLARSFKTTSPCCYDFLHYIKADLRAAARGRQVSTWAATTLLVVPKST